MKKLGVLIVGVHGAVASTVIAGVKLMAKGLVPRLGMLTERTDQSVADSLTNLLDFAPLDGLVFGGWDVRMKNTYEAAISHKVLGRDLLDQVKGELEATQAWPAVFQTRYAEHVKGDNIVQASSYREELQMIRKNIEAFKRQHGVDHIVMVNLASTERWQDELPVHKSLAAFEKGLDANDESISPAMRYFYVANELGIPYCNFAPSLTNVPALQDHAEKHQNPYCGMDGKTGQTLLKTVLAPMMRVRRLHIDGWYSTNFLGNNDGLILQNPESNKTKVMSKASVLDSCVGYHVENHQVHIHYYKPRGDAKEAWDNIDIVGFAGVPMQMKVNFLCQDSVLAAPLILDLVRILDVAKDVGEKGIQRQVSLFFKSPYAAPGEQPVHDLFKQEKLLVDWAQKVAPKQKRVGKNGTAERVSAPAVIAQADPAE